MTKTNIFTCDRCGKRAEGDRAPSNWHPAVNVMVNAPGWPSYSGYFVSETYEHLCDDCTLIISNGVKAVVRTPAEGG